MRKILLLLAGAAVLWIPAVSVAGDSSSRSKPASTGAARESSGERRDTPDNGSGPAITCKSERSSSTFAATHNKQTFTQFYGTNAGRGGGAGANAFGKCVSTLAKHRAKNGRKHDLEDDVSPAMACKAMRASDHEEFQTTYGARPNAFGKCVSDHAHAKNG